MSVVLEIAIIPFSLKVFLLQCGLTYLSQAVP